MPHLRNLALIVLSLSSLASAQRLTVNGSDTTANLPLDPQKTHEIRLTGPSGLPHYWAFDQDPGPTVIGSFVLPIGITAGTIDLGMGQPFPAGGRSFSFSTGDPSLIGATWYSVGVWIDPLGNPIISNGVAFTLVAPGGEAGPDTATFVGQPTALDGSLLLDATGALPVGTAVQWTVTGAPAGGTATLAGETTAQPTFAADTPGTYAVEVVVTSGAGLSADQVLVDVFEVSLNNVDDGAFVGGPFALDGTLAGPDPAAFSVNGVPTTVTAGAFQAGLLATSGVMNGVDFRVVSQNGAVIERTVTAILGQSAPIGSVVTAGTSLRLGGVTLDALEVPVELLLANLPLNTLFSSLPPIPLIPSGAFTATLQFTGASYDQNNVDFDIFPATGAIGIRITLNTLQIDGTLTGSTFLGPYSEVVTITADSVDIVGELVLSPNSQGMLELTLQNNTASFTNFNFQVTGLLGFLVGLVEPLVQGALELAFAQILEILPPVLNPLLGTLPSTIDLTPAGVPLIVDLPLQGLSYDVAGLTLALGFGLTTTASSPTAPIITDVFSTAGGLPLYGATTPGGFPFDAATGLNDDVLNQTLASLTVAGAFDQDTSAAALGTPTAGALDALVPGAGFGVFAPTTPVILEVRHTTAPVITFDPMGATLHVGNVRVLFAAEPVPGYRVPVLLLGASGTAPITIGVDPVSGALTLIPGTVSLGTTVASSYPGFDASGTVGALTPALAMLVPQLLGPLGALPLPTAGAAGTVVEVSYLPSNPDVIATFVDLP